jgi:hypothetical protein
MQETRMVYQCPDCGFLSSIGQMHEHQDGEWVRGEDLKTFYQMLRWWIKVYCRSSNGYIRGKVSEKS